MISDWTRKPWKTENFNPMSIYMYLAKVKGVGDALGKSVW